MLLAASLIIAGLGGAQPHASAAVPDPIIRDSTLLTLYARLLRAEDQRSFDTVTLRAASAARDPALRHAAAISVARLAPTHRAEALPWLRVRARDRDPSVAAAAVFGLGLVHDTVSLGTLSGILVSASTKAAGVDPDVAVTAAWSLGELGLPARAELSRLLVVRSFGSPAATSRVQRALLVAASKIRPLDFAAVRPFLASNDVEIRWAAAYAIARQRSPAGASALLAARGGDAAFRAEVAGELTSGTAGDSLASSAFARLRILLTDADAHVRINAARSLGTYGPRARELLLEAIHDRDANVRVASAQSVATVFARDSTSWRDAWAADSGFKFHKSLMESAVTAGFPIPADSAWRASPDWRLRAAALGAWSGNRDTVRARSLAIVALHDVDGRVRAAAYDVLALSDTAKRDSTVQAALRTALSDSDLVAREGLPDYKRTAGDSLAARRTLAWYEDAVRKILLPSLAGHPPRARLLTARGEITLTLAGREAPLTVLNFVSLAEHGNYDGLRFHRVVPGFVAQHGDPRGDGNGGPGYAIRDELTLLPYARGAVGMALSGPDTGGSQYFLTLTPRPHLDGHYTVFGRVSSGLSAMDALVEGDSIHSVKILW